MRCLRLLLSAIGSCLLLSLGGCYAVTIGVVAGALALSGGSSTSAPTSIPRIAVAQVLNDAEAQAENGYPFKITYRVNVTGARGEPLTLRPMYRVLESNGSCTPPRPGTVTPEGFAPATIENSSVPLNQVGNGDVTFVWDAQQDLGSCAARSELIVELFENGEEIRPEDTGQARLDPPPVRVGSSPPEITTVALEQLDNEDLQVSFDWIENDPMADPQNTVDRDRVRPTAIELNFNGETTAEGAPLFRAVPTEALRGVMSLTSSGGGGRGSFAIDVAYLAEHDAEANPDAPDTGARDIFVGDVLARLALVDEVLLQGNPFEGETGASRATEQAFRYDNNESPVVEILSVSGQDAASGVLAIRYRIADSDCTSQGCDEADVEFRVQAGNSRDEPALEYPSALSAGLKNLATFRPGDSSGEVHTFLWDIGSQLADSPSDRILLIATASDREEGHDVSRLVRRTPVPGLRTSQTIDLSGLPTTAVDADILGADGVPELIVNDRRLGLLSVYRQEAGGLSLVDELTTTDPSIFVARGDFNGDGIDDIVSLDDDPIPVRFDFISFFLGTADSVLDSDQSGTRRVGRNDSDKALAVADFDGDGTDDVVIANSNSNDLTLLLGSTGPLDPDLLRPGPDLPGFEISFSPQAVVVLHGADRGRLAGEGLCGTTENDLLVLSGPPSPQMHYFGGDASGLVSIGPIVPTYPVGGTRLNPQSVAAFNADGIGPYDVLVANFDPRPEIDEPGGPPAQHGLTLFPREDCTEDPRPRARSLSLRGRPSAVLTTRLRPDDTLRQDVLVAVQDPDTLAHFRFLAEDPEPTVLDPISVGTRPVAMVLTDVDADGDADVVVANQDSNDVTVLRNIDGTLSPLSRIEVGEGEPRLLTNDFNNDGNPDVAVISRESASLSILESPSSGLVPVSQFATPGDFSTQGPPAYGDLDDDGFLDAVFADRNSGSLLYFRGGPDGLRAELELPAGNNPIGVAIGDFNNDGFDDLASISPGNSTLAIHRGSDAGPIFDAGTLLSAPPLALWAGRLDDDEFADLVITLPQSPGDSTVGQLVWMRGSPTGLTSEPDLESLQAPFVPCVAGPAPKVNVDQDPSVIRPIDLDQDGTVELLILHRNRGRVTYLDFSPAGPCVLGNCRLETSPQDVAIGDFNGDGLDDVFVVYNLRDDRPTLLLGQPNALPGRCQSNRVAALSGFGNGGKSLASGDFNGDGFDDIVSGSAGPAVGGDRGSSLDYALGSPDGLVLQDDICSALDPVSDCRNSDPRTLHSSDLNGDGYPDVLVGYGADESFYSFLAGGPEGLRLVGSPSLGDAALQFLAADFDSDGFDDVAVAGDNHLSVLRQTYFQPRVSFLSKCDAIACTNTSEALTDPRTPPRYELSFLGPRPVDSSTPVTLAPGPLLDLHRREAATRGQYLLNVTEPVAILREDTAIEGRAELRLRLRDDAPVEIPLERIRIFRGVAGRVEWLESITPDTLEIAATAQGRYLLLEIETFGTYLAALELARVAR